MEPISKFVPDNQKFSTLQSLLSLEWRIRTSCVFRLYNPTNFFNFFFLQMSINVFVVALELTFNSLEFHWFECSQDADVRILFQSNTKWQDGFFMGIESTCNSTVGAKYLPRCALGLRVKWMPRCGDSMKIKSQLQAAHDISNVIRRWK